MLACRLGLRVSDIVGLRLEHLHWREDRIEMAQAKTGAPLVLPLSEEVGGALIDYLQHGRPAQSRKGLHTLRHTVATRLLEVGTPLETIAGILGHLSLETTQIYAKVDIEALRRAALDPEVLHE